MGAAEWFEALRAEVTAVAAMEASVELARERAVPHAGGGGAHGGGGGDPMAGVDRLVDEGTVEALAARRAALEPRLKAATVVLYGKDGRGGVAARMGSTDADILLARYCWGWGWDRIAREMCPDGSASPRHWCRTRARRALARIDRLDLTNS